MQNESVPFTQKKHIFDGKSVLSVSVTFIISNNCIFTLLIYGILISKLVVNLLFQDLLQCDYVHIQLFMYMVICMSVCDYISFCPIYAKLKSIIVCYIYILK